jgi:hypothetical protein
MMAAMENHSSDPDANLHDKGPSKSITRLGIPLSWLSKGICTQSTLPAAESDKDSLSLDWSPGSGQHKKEPGKSIKRPGIPASLLSTEIRSLSNTNPND